MAANSYARHAATREISRQRNLMGETLAAFHARETAPPPTLAEIYAENRRNRERCGETLDLLAWQPNGSQRSQRKA